jgi:hypothetical protein
VRWHPLENNSPTPDQQDLPTLIQALRDSGDAPEPALLEAILAHGPAAAPPLLTFLEEMLAAHSIPARMEEPLGWAAGLLSQLAAAEAAPLLLTLAPRSAAVAEDFTDLMVRLGDAARPVLHASLRGESGRPDPAVRELVVRALGEMGYHPDSAALLIERAGRHLRAVQPDRDLAEMYGYALLSMRAPEARPLLDELEATDPEEWFPETEETLFEILSRGPAPPRAVPDVVTLLKQRRAWRALHPGEHRPLTLSYAPRPERDPEEQARKRAARQARRAAAPSAKPPPKPHRRRR